MKSLAFFLLASFYLSANAAIYNYDYWWPRELAAYFEQVNSTQINTAQAGKCAPVFKNAIRNGVLDIRYALGYFDDSQGIEINYNGINYGISPSLDIVVFNVLRGFLKAPCNPNSGQVLCGFSEQGEASKGLVVLSKNINLLGQRVTARITLTQASASESFVQNKSNLKDRQQFLTQQSEQNYFGGIGSADIVFYNGHSRNGGGPDFNPPVLTRDLHVDYKGYYEVRRIGIKRVLDLIKKGGNKDQILGFFSCYSQKHFYRDLLAANPKQKLVLSADTIDYLDTLVASSGYLEGLLRGYCGQDLADIAKQGEKIKEGFQGFQIR